MLAGSGHSRFCRLVDMRDWSLALSAGALFPAALVGCIWLPLSCPAFVALGRTRAAAAAPLTGAGAAVPHRRSSTAIDLAL